MSRTPRSSRRLLSLGATSAMTAGLLALPFASAAYADVTTVTVTNKTQTVPDGTNATINGTYTESPDTASEGQIIKVLFVSGSNGNGGNGDNAADATATTDPAADTFTYTYNPAGPGTDTLRFFADLNGDNVYQANEPSDTATVITTGPAQTVNLQPDSDTAAVGTCNEFSVSATDAGGRALGNQQVIIDISQPTPTGGTPANTYFCDPNGAAASAPTGSQSYPSGTSPGTAGGSGSPSTSRRLVVTTGPNGEPVVFGIASDQPGTETVTAFVDNPGGTANTFDPATDARDISTKTWVAGGPDAVNSVDAEPETGQAVVNNPHAITATLYTGTNNSGSTVAGVTPGIYVNGAPSGSCTPSDNNGQSTCTYTPTATGTDTITIYVTQSDSTAPGPDANEPQDTVTRTVVAAPPANLTVSLTCEGTSANFPAGTYTDSDCRNPITDPTEVFTAVVTAPDGPDADTDRDPVSGIQVDFMVVSPHNDEGGGTSANDSTVSPTSGTTGADGKVTTTLTNPNPVTGDHVYVQATIAGQDTDPITAGNQPSTDQASKYWQSRRATTLVLTPETVTAQSGSAQTFTAHVTDQFGAPVVGANVDFVVSGARGENNTANGKDRITDANGDAAFQLTDTGPTATENGNTVTAWADVVTENDTDDGAGEPNDSSTINYVNRAVTPSAVDIDVDGTCNPTGTEPTKSSNNSATYTFDADPVGDEHLVCALVQNNNGTSTIPLAGQTVTFTITGVGTFENADGTAGGKTTTATTDSNGIARVNVRSDGAAGTQSITATAGSASETGTITYQAAAGQARTITLTPVDPEAKPGTSVEIVATVKDRFGNPVAGVSVTFSESGPGSFRSGTNPQTIVTGADGTARVEVVSLATETGDQTVTATINSATTDCELAAGTPAGSTAGSCSDSTTVTWTNTPSNSTLRITSPTTDYHVVAGTRIEIRGDGCVDKPGTVNDVVLYEKFAGESEYHQLSGGATCATDGTWTYGRRINTNTYLFARGDNGQTASIRIFAFRVVSPKNGAVVAPGTRVFYRGAGAIPGEVVTIFERVAGESGYRKLSGGATVQADGTWLYRRYVSRTTYVYFDGLVGTTPSIQVFAAR